MLLGWNTNTHYLFILRKYFPLFPLGMFIRLALCSFLEHVFTNTFLKLLELHDQLRMSFIKWWERSRRNIKKKKHRLPNGLTCNHAIRAVPLGVLLALTHAAGAGLCLVGA